MTCTTSYKLAATGVSNVELRSSVHCSVHEELFRLHLLGFITGVEPLVTDDMFLGCRIPKKCSMKTHTLPCT